VGTTSWVDLQKLIYVVTDVLEFYDDELVLSADGSMHLHGCCMQWFVYCIQVQPDGE
jgi:hypothetical protein